MSSHQSVNNQMSSPPQSCGRDPCRAGRPSGRRWCTYKYTGTGQNGDKSKTPTTKTVTHPKRRSTLPFWYVAILVVSKMATIQLDLSPKHRVDLYPKQRHAPFWIGFVYKSSWIVAILDVLPFLLHTPSDTNYNVLKYLLRGHQ